jgi:hypothetical protein
MQRLSLTIVGRALPGRSCGPHRAVKVALQVGEEHVGAVDGDADEAKFTAEVTLKDDGDMTGKAVHGRRGERFLYLAWLEHGDKRFRRAKLQLDGIPPAELAGRAGAAPCAPSWG